MADMPCCTVGHTALGVRLLLLATLGDTAYVQQKGEGGRAAVVPWRTAVPKTPASSCAPMSMKPSSPALCAPAPQGLA